MPHKVQILATQPVTHDVGRLTLEKPNGFHFTPGQATDVSVDKDGWRDNKHPFTFTGLNEWDRLEFTIKIYPERNGVTDQIGKLKAGDHLLIADPWGTITYKGKGTFIAGGAGVTPFIAILRDLDRRGEIAGNRLIFSNKTASDIILRDEWEKMDGLETNFVVTKEDSEALPKARIDKNFLASNVADFDQHFYVCGPDKMVADVKAALKSLGADAEGLVFEE